MPMKSDTFTYARELVLIVGLAAVVCGLSAIATEGGDLRYQDQESWSTPDAPALALASATVARSDGGCRCPAIVNGPAPTMPAPNRAELQEPEVRFSGDGAGRHQLTSTTNPYDGRAFILETASNLHRRGWLSVGARAPAVTIHAP